MEAYILVKVLVSGACGRMGQAVLKAVLEDKELELVGAVDLKAGTDAGTLVGLAACGVKVQTDLAKALEETKPEVMSIEKLFFAQNVTTAMSVSRHPLRRFSWIGSCHLCARRLWSVAGHLSRSGPVIMVLR